MLIGGGDDRFIPDRTGRLDDSGYPHRRRRIDPIAEGEKGIGGHDRSFDRKSRIEGLHDTEPAAYDPAHLAGTDADSPTIMGIDDGIGFYPLDYPPGK